MSDIYQEFANDQDIINYVETYKQSIIDAALAGNEKATRVFDHCSLMNMVIVTYKLAPETPFKRCAEFAIMLASEAIRDYEISIGLRNDHSA